jgi:hypothetical protein
MFRTDHAGARAEIPLQLPQPQDEDGIHRRPRHLAHHAHAINGRRFGLADAVPGQRDERVLQRAPASLLPQRRGARFILDTSGAALKEAGLGIYLG